MSSSPLSIPATNKAVDNPSATAELSATTVALTSPDLAVCPVDRDSAHAEIRRLGASAYAQWQPRFPLLHIALIRWLAMGLWLQNFPLHVRIQAHRRLQPKRPSSRI